MSESEQPTTEESTAEVSVSEESTSTTDESTEEASTTEESTTERSTRLRTDAIAVRFFYFAQHYEDVLSTLRRTARNDEMVDELAERHQLIDELESSLLPLIIDHIDSISLSLDLKEPPNHSSLDLELASKLLKDLENTLDRTVDYVYSICAKFEDDDEDDGSFKRCKKFRRMRLQIKIGEWTKVHIVDLFYTYHHYIKTHNLTAKSPVKLQHQTEKAELREKIIRVSDLCRRSINETIRWSKKSDLAILQERWLSEEKLPIDALECLTQVSEPRINNLRHAPYLSHHDVVELAKLCIPIVKLTRIFMNKLTKTNAAERLFTLDPEIDSKNLMLLRFGTKDIGHLLDKLTKLFLPHRELKYSGLGDEGEAFAHNLMRRLLKILQSTLLLLSLYLVPTPATVDCPSPKNQLRIWLLDFGNLCQKAIDRFLDRLFSFLPHHIRIR
ncbi:hypothetical protein Pst134EA_006997 [Puccinia striiformis f. sp. tritici]|uniref:hypothetical protein n=1 Tax=Puccinia striiformis f. sp. tritici TaxID=168172 RepID=UPI0020081230|nr:hypothetical protein Pst134EA_006997 [Puccinia striiformis f. sp. tritici]KAH9469716.1 hypothetical protein Pst134EA_006997 [Puccinia striiformis f. sp. tritici]KAI9608712.1 hypothetical protein H4Q26_004898 [Puccinia striiformis f. sp. tritici PST-130]